MPGTVSGRRVFIQLPGELRREYRREQIRQNVGRFLLSAVLIAAASSVYTLQYWLVPVKGISDTERGVYIHLFLFGILWGVLFLGLFLLLRRNRGLPMDSAQHVYILGALAWMTVLAVFDRVVSNDSSAFAVASMFCAVLLRGNPRLVLAAIATAGLGGIVGLVLFSPLFLAADFVPFVVYVILGWFITIILENSTSKSFLAFHELSRVNEELKSISFQDVLTGLNNRRFIFDFLDKLIKEAERYKRPLTILLLDIDYFKQVNDTYGHPAGDRVLRSFAEQLLQILRCADSVGRVGGEEFIVVLPETDGTNGFSVAQRLRTAISEKRFEGISWPITVSIGCAEYREGDDIDTLVKRADAGLYMAKKSGRNCVKSA